MKSGVHVIILLLILVAGVNKSLCAQPIKKAYDIDMAKEICDGLPLDNLEGIWIYPDDNVSVLILSDQIENTLAFPSYSLHVVETEDARLKPGDCIGKLYGTAQENVYKIELSTESKNELLLRPKSCLVNLAKDGDAMIIKKQKAPFRGRLNFNFNRLLPGFWKIVSVGISQSPKTNSVEPPVGMVKIYPSYDGNGSSKRKVRYL